jgi:hypothetical protein
MAAQETTRFVLVEEAPSSSFPNLFLALVFRLAMTMGKPANLCPLAAVTGASCLRLQANWSTSAYS